MNSQEDIMETKENKTEKYFLTETGAECKKQDCILRKDAIDAADKIIERDTSGNNDVVKAMTAWKSYIKALPSPQTEPELTELLVFCPKCGHTMSVIDKDTLVRCRDCTYWMPHVQLGYDEDNEEYHDYCARLIPDDEFYAFTRDADDFCSRGVRRTDE